MFKSFFTNSIGILVSRILGFLRDVLSASLLGANVYSDIFFIAFKLPNLFRRIFAEGAFTQSFLPAYTSTLQKPRFAYITLQKFMLIILSISLLVTFFSGIVTEMLAFGFSDELKTLAEPLIVINFYYLVLIFSVTYLAALLQYKEHFATTAFSTGLLNIALIVALLISYDKSKLDMVYYLSYGVIAGGVLQLVVHLIAAKKYHILKLLYIGSRSKKEVTKAEKNFNKSFIPSIFGNSTAHLSSFLDTWLATFLTAGSISYLYYANRLFQFPLALFAIAVSIALFPKMTKQIEQKKITQAESSARKSFWFLLYILSFATVVGILYSELIVRMTFERGEFTSEDTLQSAFVLEMYLVGLLPFGIVKIFSSWLYASHRHLEAAKLSAISLGFNILFSLLLFYPLGAAGLALASSLSGFILLVLSIKAFEFKRFKSFFILKKVLLYLLFVIISIAVLFFIKGFVCAIFS